MKKTLLMLATCGGIAALAQTAHNDPAPAAIFGPAQEATKLVTRFDKDGNQRLNSAERKAAREFIQGERSAGRGRRGPGAFNRRQDEQAPAQPGPRISPDQAKLYPDAPLYASNVVRTFFLAFENADWEKELSDFNNTDVEVPARLIVDGKTYRDVGVHFRGASSFFTVSEGRKRSLNVSLDFVHEQQHIGGYRTLNLLNSHADPSFLRTVLYSHIAREYIPAPQANYARVVINGESWGLYVNAEQFNKDLVREQFGTTKGARWKVQGSPNGQGSLKYLGDDPAPYERIYQIKSKNDPKAWAALVQLCRVLNETPRNKLESALTPLLDIDGALKFLALENALINNDGYWVRASDYNLYQDVNGRFHILPHDMNETFTKPGGPGFGGPGIAGAGRMLAAHMLAQGDQNSDGKITAAEFKALASAWFGKLDRNSEGKVSTDQFAERIDRVLPSARNMPPGNADGRGNFQSPPTVGPALFNAFDSNKDGTLTRPELLRVFADWHTKWDAADTGSLDEERLRSGLAEVIPAPGGRGRGGRPGGVRVDGFKLDPLVAANDANKPLISKLLAIPALRARYLGYVRDIAERWLDWKNLGPLAQSYQALIEPEVKVDTRKLASTEDFLQGLTGDVAGSGSGPGGGGVPGLKSFAEQRRDYLLKQLDGGKATRP